LSRRLIYKIDKKDSSRVGEEAWKSVLRLQHWYNSEFEWTGNKLAFKRYAMFPNVQDFADLDHSIWEIIALRHQRLAQEGKNEEEIVAQLEKDGLVFVKWGGYFDECYASGFTRVADNEWSAYLVCDFLLKVSRLCPEATVIVCDEGKFIKTGRVGMKAGHVLLKAGPDGHEALAASRHVFSVVNPEKYGRRPHAKHIIPEFSKLTPQERLDHLKQWNWLGYDDSFDHNGDDVTGFDLNLKVKSFLLVRD
jgi:hypothetical protein